MRPFGHNFVWATLLLTLIHVPGSRQQPPETTDTLITSVPTFPATDTSILAGTSFLPSLTIPFTSLIDNVPQIVTVLGADNPLFSYLPPDAWIKNTTVPDCALSRDGIRSATKANSTISFPLSGNSFSIRAVVGPTPAKFSVSYGSYRQEFNTSSTSTQPVCREFTFTLPSKLYYALAKQDSSIEIQHGGCADASQSDCAYNHDGATIRRSTSSAATKLLPASYGLIAPLFVFMLM
ncbi:hypothetical protein FRC14_003979 [Serendipita sp. 396]|nr:hypothetical protein FRC14_003979 [Serendipita sp. 396]